jgi:hypothetical protein
MCMFTNSVVDHKLQLHKINDASQVFSDPPANMTLDSIISPDGCFLTSPRYQHDASL